MSEGYQFNRGALTPAELAYALRTGLEDRRQRYAPNTLPELPAFVPVDPIASLRPLCDLQSYPVLSGPGVIRKVVRLVRRLSRKLINPWLERQSQYNSQAAAVLESQFAAVSEHLQLLTTRVNEVTTLHVPMVQAVDRRVNECFYALNTRSPVDDQQRSKTTAVELAYLQTRMPEPPGCALVLSADHNVPTQLVAFGYSVLMALTTDADNLPLHHHSLRLVVAFDSGVRNIASFWSDEMRSTREAVSRLLVRNGRVVGSTRSEFANDEEVMRRCAPFRVTDVARSDGIVTWTAAV